MGNERPGCRDVQFEKPPGRAAAGADGAKITDKNGLRWEIIMDADGRVLGTQEKKPKKAN